MQIVSDAWKAAHTERLLDENFLEITIEIGDPDSMQDGTASDNGADTLSNTAEIANGVTREPEKYALLEFNAFSLDGTYAVIPDEHPNDTGFVSADMCGDDGVFANPPKVSIAFSQTFERVIPGVTITWAPEYDEYPRRFSVTAYNGEAVVASVTVDGNDSAVTPVNVDIANYNRIEIAVYEWCLPLHRARIAEAFIGLQKMYRKSQILSYNNNVSIAPLSNELPRRNIDYEVSNITGEYDPNNPEGITRYLIERQALNVRYGMRVNGKPEYISGGRYYLNSWEAPQNGITAKFRASGAMEYMQGLYMRGRYRSSGATLYELAEEVLIDADLPKLRDGSSRWYIDESLRNITTTAPLPVATRAECLQLIASAGRCVLNEDRDGRITISPMKTEASDYAISAFNSYSRPEVQLSKQLKAADVDVYSYYAEETGVKLYEGVVPVDGTQTILLQFEESAIDITAALDGGTLNSAQYYANACELNITASGDVSIVLTGTRLKNSVRTYSLAAGEEGENERLSNPLITTTSNASAVANHIKNVLTNRRIFETDWRADTRLDAGDIVKIENKFGTETAHVTKLKYHFSGGFRATGESRATN